MTATYQISKINYLAPVVEVEIAGKIYTEISHFVISACHFEPSAQCLLSMPTPMSIPMSTSLSKPSASNGAAKKVFHRGDMIAIRWGYEGFDLKQIFTGFVREVYRQGSEIVIEAIDRAALLFDTRVTRAFQFETPTAIIQSLLHMAKVDEYDYEIEQIDKPLNRLPLVNNTIAEAIHYINRRTGLEYDFWFDPDGKFHWQSRDKAKHSGYRLEYGQNILVYKLSDGGHMELTTVGLPLFHSQLIDVAGLDGESSTYIINKIRHTFGPGNRGSRSSLWLNRVA